VKSFELWQAAKAKRAAARSATHRGSAFEEELGDGLAAAGWAVDITKLNRRFVGSRSRGYWTTTKGDFFTAFDIIALHREQADLFIQATIDRSAVREKMRRVDAAVGVPSRGREHLVVTRAADGIHLDIWRRMKVTENDWVQVTGLYRTLDIGWGIS
jgi:hypothetical protein